MPFQNQFNECERDKFTQKYFHFLIMSQKIVELRLTTFQIQFNECERDKSLDNIFSFERVRKYIKLDSFGSPRGIRLHVYE
jgi:hypothetical protein